VSVGSLILRTSASRFLKLMELKSLLFPFFGEFSKSWSLQFRFFNTSRIIFFLALGLREIKEIAGSHERTGSLG
jgi:hypothetical protein